MSLNFVSLQKENISTFKGEFLPHLIKKQHYRRTIKAAPDTTSDLNVITKNEDNILHVGGEVKLGEICLFLFLILLI